MSRYEHAIVGEGHGTCMGTCDRYRYSVPVRDHFFRHTDTHENYNIIAQGHSAGGLAENPPPESKFAASALIKN